VCFGICPRTFLTALYADPVLLQTSENHEWRSLTSRDGLLGGARDEIFSISTLSNPRGDSTCRVQSLLIRTEACLSD